MAGAGHNSGAQSRCAIACDFDETVSQTRLGDVARTLGEHGFSRRQGSLYHGEAGTDAVGCVLAAQALVCQHAWFSAAVRDIRMLRIEDTTDLMPAVIARADARKLEVHHG